MKEIEKRMLILFSIIKQNHKATKKQVLDYIIDNNLVSLSEKDLQVLQSRGEERWRNDFSFIRQHLVENGFLKKEERSYWEITESGKKYFNEKISESINNENEFTPAFIDLCNASETINILVTNEAFELFEDNQELKNETTASQIELTQTAS